MPSLQPIPEHLRPNAPEVKAFVAATKGGPVASRMIAAVHYHSPHASEVLGQAPVLFWLFKNYKAEDIAEIIGKHGGARAVLREEFDLPKVLLKLRAPWPQDDVAQIIEFLKQFPPAHIANVVPDEVRDQFKMLRTFARFATTGGNVSATDWDKLHAFIVKNWKSVDETDDPAHTCDYLWQNAEAIPPKINARNLQRQVDAWDIEIRSARVYGSNESYPALRDYPEGVVLGGVVFTLLDSEIALRTEGLEMSHCVGGYTALAQSGRSIIWHVSGPEKERATLELQPREGGHMIKQNRGPHNAKVSVRLGRAARDFCNFITHTTERRGYKAKRIQ